MEALTAGLEPPESDRLAELDALAGIAARLVPLEREARAAPAQVVGGETAPA